MRIIKIITALTGVLVLAVGFLASCSPDDGKKPDGGTETDDIGNVSVEFIYDNDEPSVEVDCPWDDEGAKQPSEYTWKEFEALSGPQQIAFQNHFESIEDFDAWMQKAEYIDKNGVNPWEEPSAKQPSEYTWEEFEALNGPQQIQFQYSFNSFEDFEVWLDANQPK